MGIGTAGIIGGVSSLAGSAISASGAGKAANAQQQAAQQAGQLIQGNAQQGLALQRTAGQQEQSNLSPFLNAGQTAISNLSGMQQFQAPTGVTEQNDPGYQFQLTQGLKALQNSSAARGGLLSSGTAKAVNDYAQGQAASGYQNVYNRALNTYQTNFGNQMGIANLGANVGTNLSSLQQQNANQSSNILGNSAAEQAQQINNAGAARASGYAGQANAWSQGVAGAGNNLAGYTALNALNGQNPYPLNYNPGGGPGQLYGNNVTGLYNG